MACLADGADQTIDFAALPALTYGHAPLQLTATASSGLSVSFASSDETAVQIREKDGVWTATVFRSGTITITASQSGDANWNAAPEVARDLVVASRAVPERELSQLAAFEAGTTIVGFASGDVDGDGVPELLVGLDNGKAKVLTYSDGAFTELAELEVGAGHVDGMIVADADGDEENEIVALHNNGDAGGGMAVFEYRPDTASFEKVWSVAKNTPRMGRGPAVGDIDADGSPEIVLPVSWYTRRAYVYRAAAENDYQEVSSFGASCDWSDAVVADTTGDGLLETVLTTSENPSGDHLYIRKWDGAAYQQTSLDVGSLAQCAVGDLTGDGVADIVATSPELRFQSSVSPGLRLVSHLGSTYEILAEHQPGTGVSHPRVGDLLGAGLPAVSVRNATGDSVLLWTGSEFAEVAQLENGDGTVPMDKRDTCIVDFDGDLVAEWVVQNAARTGLLVYQLLPPNTAPVGVDDTYETVQNMALEVPAPGILANDSDAEGDALTAVKATDPAHGTLAFAEDGSFTYTPTADYVGEDTFTYTVNDGRADSASTTVTIDVFDPDTDDDQLPDEWEIEHFGNLDQGADDDSDVDAATNAQEYAGGTDPMDPLSVPGLVAYYPLDSDAADVTGNGHDGTVDAAVAFGTTACGSAALLSGDHGGIEVPHSADLSFGEESFSLSVAFQVGADDLAGMEGSLMALVSKFLETGGWDARWRLAMLDDGRVQFLWSSLITLDRTITTESSYADGGWHHVVVVIDRDSTPPYPRIYVDGVEATVTRDGSGSSPEDALNGSIDNSVSLFIGQDTYYKDQDFQGAIDDVRLYGRVLGQREISALADAYSLVAYYPLDSDATDVTGNGHDGTADSAVAFGTTAYGSAAVFSGNHGGIEVAHSADLNFGEKSFSVAVACQVSPDELDRMAGPLMALVSKFQGTGYYPPRWYLSMMDDGRLRFLWCNSTTQTRDINTELSYADGRWHHVVVVVDRDSSPPYPRLYVDGTEAAVTRGGGDYSTDALAGSIDNSVSLFIGQDTYYKDQAFQGAIDDVRLYGRGLSVSEISALADAYSLVPTHTVSFDLGAHGTRTGGGELTQTIDHGDAATEPTFTVEVGWTFTGWDTAFDNVTDDLTATAQYAVTTYTVAFDLGDHGTRTGGGELTQTINHGDAATEPTFTVQGGWTFTGWDTAFANVTADLTATAQYSATGTDPFGDPVVYPNTAMTILVQVSRSQGEAEEGDVVGAFVDGELRGKASVLLVDGVPYANLTVNVDAEGEAITLKLYDASANATEDGNRTVAGAAATSLGTPTDPVEVVFGLATLDIELAAGWNQVSLNLRPTDPTCDASFAGISSVLQKAIGGGGNYTPGWGALNTLTRFEDGLGYWVKVSAATTWTVEGILLDAASTPIDLSGGWNHIAFVGPSASTVDGALAGISGVLQKVIGDGGNYTPGWGALNTLTTMEPGIGYWVKVSSGTTLTYGFAAPSSRATASMDRAAPGWAAVQPDPPATAHLIVACVTLDGEPVVAGSKLGVFVNDQCRAVGDVIDIDGDSFFNLTVLMGTTGETAEFRLYDATGDVLLDTDFTTTLMPGGSDGTPTEPVDIGFSSPVVQHTVTFKPGLHGDLDGGTPDVIVAVADGDPVPTAPAVTAAEGWVHVGWDWVSARRGDAPTAITGDWAVTALYEEDAPAPAAWQLELVLDGAVPGTLSIGMRPDATDGWDAGVDEQYPLPAPGQACFASGDLALSYAADYHALAETGEFLLLVSASDDAPATVAWDASGLPEGKFLSIYEVTLGAVSPNRADVPRGLVGNTGLNMALAESLAVPAGETRSYVVTYGDELVFDLRFEAGWNLISLPIEPSSPALDVVLSDGQVLRDGFRGTIYSGSVCTWSSQGYADVTELHACTGYWIHVPEAQVIPVAGQPASQTQLGLARGWNQCGVEAECEVPADGRIVGTPWVWNPLSLRYEAAQTLRPGVGFWINVSEEATIQLDGDR
jgi:hypothetical protein